MLVHGLTSNVLWRLEGTESNNNLPHKVAIVGNKSELHKIWVAETGSVRGGKSTAVLCSSLQSCNIHSTYRVFRYTRIRDLWYVPNMVLRQDLQISSVKEEIHRFSTQYRDLLYTHTNNLTVHLMVPPDHRRLRHLPTRFHE
jgi:hypothetical protein